jgi:iron complex transport system ATP-binding protein
MKLELRGAGIKAEERWLVRDASLVLRPGYLTALVGPNGSGKTTLLRLLGGLWQPTEGGALLEGHNLRAIRRREIARRVAFTPQDTHLSFAFSVREVVTMGRHPHLGRFERESERDQCAVEEAIKRADVAHLADRLITELSGGERQRVLIARSLATEADTILLDEPTANLDIAHALDVLNLCRKLADEGKTIALAIHGLNLAARYATEIVLVHAGRIAAVGAPGEVLSDSKIREVFGVQTERVVGPTGEMMFLFHRPGNEAQRGAERR